MAQDPAFAATPRTAAGLVPATADTSLTAPTNATSIITAGASGTKIEEIDVLGVGTTVVGLVNIFLHDGTTYHLFDQVAVTAITPSTTTPAFVFRKVYTNLWIVSGWSLRVTVTVAGDQSLLKVSVFGGDF